MTHKNLAVAGSLFLLGSTQYVLALIIAESIYPDYSISLNYISDLGSWGTPSAPIFNTSSIFFGLTVIVGSYLLFKHYKYRTFCFLFALAGLGIFGVGVFPEDIVVLGFSYFHHIFATFAFAAGGLSSILAFKIIKSPAKFFAIALGMLTLLAFAFVLLTKASGGLGLGVGGMERLIVYPTILFTIGFGGYLLGNNNEKESTHFQRQ
jgi:hypothetical membrane protein